MVTNIFTNTGDQRHTVAMVTNIFTNTERSKIREQMVDESTW